MRGIGRRPRKTKLSRSPKKLSNALFNPNTEKMLRNAPMTPCSNPSSMNGIRMNHFVAPTRRITSISRRRANTAVLIELYISIAAATAESRAANSMI